MERTVLVVEDHPLFRSALVDLIEEHVGARVLAAASAEEALLTLRDEHIDLILTDLGLPGAAGADAITLYRDTCDAVIVVLSGSENRQEIGAVTRAGAAVVISKSVAMGTLREVVAHVLCNRL